MLLLSKMDVENFKRNYFIIYDSLKLSGQLTKKSYYIINLSSGCKFINAIIDTIFCKYIPVTRNCSIVCLP